MNNLEIHIIVSERCKEKKHFPVLPKSLNNALQQLWILKIDDCFTFKNQQFIYVPADAICISLTSANC